MKRLFITLMACLMALAVNAQTVTISPLPQKISWGEEAFSNDTKFYVVGSSEADSDAINLLAENLEIIGVSERVNAKKFGMAKPIIIGEAGDKYVAKYVKNIPAANESYFLQVTPDKVVIAGRDNSGTFYGV